MPDDEFVECSPVPARRPGDQFLISRVSISWRAIHGQLGSTLLALRLVCLKRHSLASLT
jgi:hypothetical protein